MKPRTQKPTIDDVASLAGVGRATAARALGDYGAVSADAKARVATAAQRLGYQRNFLARSMSTGRTRTIGVVVADISNPFFSGMIRAIADTALAEGFDTLVVSTYEDLEAERQAVDVLLAKQVDGIVIASAARGIADAKHLQRAVQHLPLVLLDREIDGFAADCVVIDNRDVARRAIGTLVTAGHRRIGYVWGPTMASAPRSWAELMTATADSLQSEHDRLLGYQDALIDGGLEPDPALVTTSPKVEQEVAAALADMLSMPDPPTAIFASEEEAVLGLLRAMQTLTISCPDDVSIIGLDDSSWAQVYRPPLTMVAQPLATLGREATEQLLARVRGDDSPPASHLVRASIVTRQSVREIPR